MIHWRWRQRGRGGHRRWFTIELGMRLGIGFEGHNGGVTVWLVDLKSQTRVHLGSQAMAAGVGGWDKAMSQRPLE